MKINQTGKNALKEFLLKRHKNGIWNFQNKYIIDAFAEEIESNPDSAVLWLSGEETSSGEPVHFFVRPEFFTEEK